jgi:hypothetical protein
MPTLSEVEAVTVIVPPTVAPFAGDVMDTEGVAGGLLLEPTAPAHPRLNNAKLRSQTSARVPSAPFSEFCLTLTKALIMMLLKLFPQARVRHIRQRQQGIPTHCQSRGMRLGLDTVQWAQNGAGVLNRDGDCPQER